MDLIKTPVNNIRIGINARFASKEPWQIIAITTSTVLFSVWLYEFIFDDESLKQRAKKTFFKYVRLIPSIKNEIDTQMNKVCETLENDVKERTKHLKYIKELPNKGLSKENVMSIVDENLKFGQFKWKDGRVSGAVYYVSPDLVNLITDVYSKTSYTNPLHPDIFPGLCKMEAEVVRIAANLFHGNDNACGTMTTGGTESILMACKAYRDYAREEKGIKKPEMIVPVTAHAAFDKASQYFKIRMHYISVDPVTTQVDIKAMKRAISSNTILLVGSAPNFPYGTMDDISAISELGLSYNIPVHVDACLGGFLTVFMADAGYPVPVCDFRLPGVTSISADTHKYGFTPKGSSLILYSDAKYRHYQYTVTTDWPGGVYGSPTISGSRAGGAIAACWATMLNFGKEGYVKATREIIHTTRYIEKGLRGIKGIFIYGQPATSVVSMGSKEFDIYSLSGALIKLGWNLNVLQYPSGIHLCVTQLHTQPGVADQFLNDVRNCVANLIQQPATPAEGKMALYGAAQNIPDRSLVVTFVRYFLDSMYYTPKNE
ncbi:hypothetical protein ILUMI_01769 [Ignelater luminosus]|uniref:sphinganine-1-phosphate aldolase n=1 Tax=Ignelater luminosus TaxID=2038154 RepID=A0A8K0DEP5_IGNLU|nr:hypothetical protein ILUMI_01769 [Ignelater luminosus]